jgi:hypothetical protein
LVGSGVSDTAGWVVAVAGGALQAKTFIDRMMRVKRMRFIRTPFAGDH